MPTGSGIKFYHNTLRPRMAFFVLNFDHMVAETVDNIAQDAEQWMKENAPWSDRTGAAREGLTAYTEHTLLHYALVLAHGVDYGIWLEIKNNGEYAIIEPAMLEFGPKVMEDLDMGNMAG